ncbi:MAG TPA: polysaccharide deacetylase family protein [Streptosporangiaceae bacterium]
MAYTGPGGAAVPPFRARIFPRLSGCGDPGHVALTFDDGPDPVSTPAVLNVLAEWKVHATFFMLGSMAAAAPGLVREVSAAGHQVAVHGWAHRAMTADRAEVVYGDLTRARDTMAGITGQAPAWFRPPYGILTAGALAAGRCPAPGAPAAAVDVLRPRVETRRHPGIRPRHAAPHPERRRNRPAARLRPASAAG